MSCDNPSSGFDLRKRLAGSCPVILELGCGPNKKHDNAIGIDLLDYPGVDLVGDIFDSLLLFPDKSVDTIYAYHFIEHVPDLAHLMSELGRVLKVNGIVELVAPHFSNPYFYSDPTHRAFFGLYTFCYMALNSQFARKVPAYQFDQLFRLDRVELIFKSTRPFYFRHAFKYILGLLFNSCYYMKEFYEENLCYVFPCYEVYYRLKRIDLSAKVI